MTAAHNKCLRVYFYQHTAVYVYTITEGDSTSKEERTEEVPAWNGHVLESRTPNTTDLWLTNLIDNLPSLFEKKPAQYKQNGRPKTLYIQRLSIALEENEWNLSERIQTNVNHPTSSFCKLSK